MAIRGTRGPQVPSKRQILDKSSETKGQIHDLFNKKITFLPNPRFSCTPFLIKAHVIDNYSQVIVKLSCFFKNARQIQPPCPLIFLEKPLLNRVAGMLSNLYMPPPLRQSEYVLGVFFSFWLPLYSLSCIITACDMN